MPGEVVCVADRGLVALVASGVWTLGAWAQAPAQRQPLQLQLGVLAADVSPEAGYLILPEPPRELRRVLSEAERAIAEHRYSEAVEALERDFGRPVE